MIYADCNATTPLLPSVKKYLMQRLEHGPFANPQSLHFLGQQIKGKIAECRNIVADIFHTYPDQVFFNSGSSEAISQFFWMTIGQDLLKKNAKFKIIASPVEHAAVLQNIARYQSLGAEVIWLQVDQNGILDMQDFATKIKLHEKNLSLVCAMAANNETGVYFPFAEIAKSCNYYSTPYLCDTTQVVGKSELHFENLSLDFLCASGHKLGAPFGAGFFILKNIQDAAFLIAGGGQEHGLRGGTENYLGIETLTMALSEHDQNLALWKNLEQCKLQFEASLKRHLPEALIIAEQSKRLPNTTLVAFPGLHSQGIQIELESHNIFVTTSSACSDNEPDTSKVLKSMGITDRIGRSVLRISTDMHFSATQYDQLLKCLIKSVQKIKKIS